MYLNSKENPLPMIINYINNTHVIIISENGYLGLENTKQKFILISMDTSKLQHLKFK